MFLNESFTLTEKTKNKLFTSVQDGEEYTSPFVSFYAIFKDKKTKKTVDVNLGMYSVSNADRFLATFIRPQHGLSVRGRKRSWKKSSISGDFYFSSSYLHPRFYLLLSFFNNDFEKTTMFLRKIA